MAQTVAQLSCQTHVYNFEVTIWIKPNFCDIFSFKMWTLKIGLFYAAFVLLFLNSSKAQMPNLENVGDILQTLKDSGMMDQFEKDLKQMLFEQKPVETREDLDEGADGTDEPPVDVYEFIKAYVNEKKIKLNEKVKFLNAYF